MTLTEMLVEQIEAAGLYPRKYSGRCMYGKECVAFVTDNPIDAVLSVAEKWVERGNVAEKHDDRDYYDCGDYGVIEALRGARSDAMGLRTVVYWPKHEWPADVVRDTKWQVTRSAWRTRSGT